MVITGQLDLSVDDILRGGLDYQVIQGDKPSNTEIEIQENNDNFLIIYPDGAQQKGSY